MDTNLKQNINKSMITLIYGEEENAVYKEVSNGGTKNEGSIQAEMHENIK